MPRVETARHLHAFFPGLAGGPVEVEATTAAEVVRALDALFPGLAGYLVDERGALRRHVNLFVNHEMIVDRQRLADPVRPGDTVYIMQALSGG